MIKHNQRKQCTNTCVSWPRPPRSQFGSAPLRGCAAPRGRWRGRAYSCAAGGAANWVRGGGHGASHSHLRTRTFHDDSQNSSPLAPTAVHIRTSETPQRFEPFHGIAYFNPAVLPSWMQRPFMHPRHALPSSIDAEHARRG